MADVVKGDFIYSWWQTNVQNLFIVYRSKIKNTFCGHRSENGALYMPHKRRDTFSLKKRKKIRT